MRDTSRKMDKNFPGARTNLKSDEQVLQLKESRPLLPSKKKKRCSRYRERKYLFSIQKDRRKLLNSTILEGFETLHKSSCVETVEVQNFLMWLRSPPQQKQSVCVIVCVWSPQDMFSFFCVWVHKYRFKCLSQRDKLQGKVLASV